MFEVVATLAQRLLQAERWEDEIGRTLASLGAAAGADRVCVCRHPTDPAYGLRTERCFEWEADGLETVRGSAAGCGEPLDLAVFGSRVEALRAGEAIQCHVRTLDPAEHRLLTARGVASIAVVPILVGDVGWGFFCFHACRAEHVWSAGVIDALRTAAGILGGAIRREAIANALRESESRHRSVSDCLPLMLGYVDADERWRFVNRAGVEGLGRPREEILGRTMREVLGEDVYREARPRVEAALQGTPQILEFEVAVREGARRHAVEYHPQRGADGVVVGFLAVGTDITERWRAEENVRFQARLLDSVGQAVIATDLEGRITFWNAFAETLYGWSRDEALGHPVLELVPSDATRAQAEEIFGALRRGESWAGEFLVRHRDGSTFPASVVDSPILDEKGRLVGVVGVSFDLRERKALEEQLHQAHKMEAVGRLAGGVAHDFNNMLTAIRGYATLLETDLHPGTEARECLTEIQRAADRSADLTRQLLAYSRKQLLQPRAFRIDESIHAMDRLLRRVLGEDVDVRTHLGSGMARVRADPTQLEQVLINLAVNARDSMQPDGVLRISTSRLVVTHGDGERYPDGMGPGRYVRVTVEDNGCGMEEPVRSRIFEPFFTTKQIGRGTGLGLATVHGTVKQSGGHIWVDSEVGKGTTFTLCLPEIEDGAQEGVPHIEAEHPGGTETVLVVEDEQAVRTLTVRMLRRAGYRTLEAANGEAALVLLESSAESVDLVLSDVVMPRMSGRELMDRLVRAGWDIPVLFMSGYMDDTVLRHGVQALACDLIHKPFAAEALLRAVRDVLDSHRPDRTDSGGADP